MNNPKPNPSFEAENKEQLLNKWEIEFNQYVRQIASSLLMIVPFAIYFVAKNLITHSSIEIDLPAIKTAAILASVFGAVSLIFPWKKFPPEWFLLTAIIATVLLTFIIRASGYHHSPFIILFFLISILCAFYFKPWALTVAFLIISSGFYLSLTPGIYNIFKKPEDLFLLSVLAASTLAAGILDHRLRTYQRLACEAYEELIAQKEKIHQVERLEATLETVGGVSHKLSQPLTVALGKIQLALMDWENKKPEKEDLESVAGELLLAKNILQQFREIRKITTEDYVSGQKILKPERETPASPGEEKSSSGESGSAQTP